MFFEVKIFQGGFIMNKRLFAAIILSSMVVMPVCCKNNFTVQTQTVTPQSAAYQGQQYTPQYGAQQYTAPQYTQIPYQQVAQPQTTTTTSSNQALKGYLVSVPSGVSIQATTMSELSSATSSLGQSVALVLTNGFTYNNVQIAPAGSTITGNVIAVRKGGRAGKNGQLQIRFTQINTPYGQIIPVSAMIKTTDGTGLLVAGTAKDAAKEYGKDVAIGAASGAVLGTAMGAMSQGSVGKGAIYGTALGGGLGLVKSLWDKGVDVVIPVNSSLELLIDQPITVQATK